MLNNLPIDIIYYIEPFLTNLNESKNFETVIRNIDPTFRFKYESQIIETYTDLDIVISKDESSESRFIVTERKNNSLNNIVNFIFNNLFFIPEELINTNEINTNNEVNTNEINTNEVNTNEVNTNEVNTNEINNEVNPNTNEVNTNNEIEVDETREPRSSLNIPNNKLIKKYLIRNEIQKLEVYKTSVESPQGSRPIERFATNLIAEYNFKNYPILHGEYITYKIFIKPDDESKRIKSKIIKYIDGNLDYIKIYYDNGMLYSIDTFLNNKLHGCQYIYYEDGDIKIIETYSEGILNGETLIYYKGLKPASRYNYVNDKQVGKQFTWFKNTQLASEELFDKNGDKIYSILFENKNLLNLKINIELE